jgi:hypothetical protein
MAARESRTGLDDACHALAHPVQALGHRRQRRALA